MSIDKVSIIVVTYNPDVKELEQNIKSYISQVPLVVMIDNSTNTEIKQQIKHNFNEYKNIHIITLEDNYGIAKAQNIGIQYAMDNGYEYFIEMDQDSALPDKYVFSIYNSYKVLEDTEGKIAGIGPIAINKKDNSEYHQRESLTSTFEVDKTLSSGFFMSKKSFEFIGLKDESLFIDLVDWEWCWRAKSKGYKVFVDKSLKIAHLLGDGHKDFYFFKLGVPSPIRHYYQYRNSLLISRLNYVPFNWKVKQIAIHLLKVIFFLIFYDNKLLRLKYVLRGIKDGLIGRSGKIRG